MEIAYIVIVRTPTEYDGPELQQGDIVDAITQKAADAGIPADVEVQDQGFASDLVVSFVKTRWRDQHRDESL